MVTQISAGCARWARDAATGRGPQDRDGEQGFSLVELLVTMLVLGVVMAALTSSVVSIQRTAQRIDVRTDNVTSVRHALAVSSQLLRAASTTEGNAGEAAFRITRPGLAEFTALLEDLEQPHQVVLEMTTSGELWQRISAPVEAQDGTVTFPTVTRQRLLATDLDVSSSQFTYYRRDEAGNDVPIATANGNPEREIRRGIARVGIELRLSRDASGRVAGQTVTTDVRIPNQGVA